MLVLDTDHLSELDRATAAGRSLARRLADSSEEVTTTIITAEEQLRGWLAQINGEDDPYRLVAHYQRLQGRLTFFASGPVLPWDNAAGGIFVRLRADRLRIGTMDLRIASIVLSHDARLLSRNMSDFSRVPGLRVEDWLA